MHVSMFPPDVQQLLVIKEEVLPEWGPGLAQGLDQESMNIKEEEEELWTSQEEEQLKGLEEADIIRFPFTVNPVKNEGDETKPQLSHLQQSHTSFLDNSCSVLEQMNAAEDQHRSHLHKVIIPVTSE